MQQIFKQEKRRARRQRVYSKTLLLAKAKQRETLSAKQQKPHKSATCLHTILTIVSSLLQGVGDRFMTTDERMYV